MSITKAPDCRFHTVHSRRGLEDLGDVECLTPDPEVLGVSWHPTVLEVLAALFFTTVTHWNSILAASSSCGVKPEKSSFSCVCPHVIAVGLVDAATLAVYAALTGFTVWVMSASLVDSTVFRESATGSQAPCLLGAHSWLRLFVALSAGSQPPCLADAGACLLP